MNKLKNSKVVVVDTSSVIITCGKTVIHIDNPNDPIECNGLNYSKQELYNLYLALKNIFDNKLV